MMKLVTLVWLFDLDLATIRSLKIINGLSHTKLINLMIFVYLLKLLYLLFHITIICVLNKCKSIKTFFNYKVNKMEFNDEIIHKHF